MPIDKPNEQLALFSGIDLEEYEKGKDELTLAEFPLALAGKSPGRTGQTSVKYQDVIRDKSTGQPVTRIITIQGSEEYGLPTYYDEEILFGILQLTNLQRQGDNWPTEIRFSRYHLAKVLGLDTDGRTYKRLWNSLHRLANTTYNFNYAFFDKADAEWRPSVVITFIQTLIVHGGPVPGKNGEVTVRWNEDIHRNFRAGYLRDINIIEYREMGYPLAKALYRYLGKHFWRRPRLKFNLQTLAFEKLGLSRAYNIGQIKRALKPAIQKLEEKGVIRKVSPKQRYQKVKVGVWNIHFEKESSQEQFPMEVKSLSELETKLTGHGVSSGVAAELVDKYPEELVHQKIDEFEFLVRKGRGPNRNPGAWLSKSIKENWETDPEYKTPVEIEAEELEKLAEHRERIRKQKKKEAEEIAVREAQEKIEADKEFRVKQYLDALTIDEQAEVIDKAFKVCRDGGSMWIDKDSVLGEAERQQALEDYILPILDEDENQ